MTEGALLLRRLEHAFAAACRACPEQVHEMSRQFGGRRARLRAAGTELAERLLHPFAHLPAVLAEHGAPDLRLDLWDAGLTGVANPEPSPASSLWSRQTGTNVGGALGYSGDERLLRFARDGATTWLDRSGGHLFGCWADGREMPLFERTRPLPLVLAQWYRDQGIHFIHAGLVARHNRGALLAGRSGAGKSTTSLACLAGGLDFLGDDHIGLSHAADRTFVGHSLFGTARLDAGQLARFPRLRPHVVPAEAGDPKSLFYPVDLWPERLPPSVPIRVILLPRVIDAPACRVRPASKGEVLLALGPSTLLGLALAPKAEGLARIAALVDATPGFWLDVTEDMPSIAVCVGDLLGRQAAESPP